MVKYLSQAELVEKSLFLRENLAKDIVDFIIRRKSQFGYAILISFLYKALQMLFQFYQCFHKSFALVVHEEHFIGKDLFVLNKISKLYITITEMTTTLRIIVTQADVRAGAHSILIRLVHDLGLFIEAKDPGKVQGRMTRFVPHVIMLIANPIRSLEYAVIFLLLLPKLLVGMLALQF